MKKIQTIGYIYSYTDIADSCDGYPRISKLYKTKNGCYNAMKKDAEQYCFINKDCVGDADITYYGKDHIHVEFNPDCYCLYKIHEVKG